MANSASNQIAVRAYIRPSGGHEYGELVWTDPVTRKRRRESVGRMGYGPAQINKTRLKSLALARQAELNSDPRARIKGSAGTVAEWCETYLAIREAEGTAKRTLAGDRSTVKHLVAGLGQRRLRDITPAQADDWTTGLAGAPHTRRGHLLRARRIFARAVDRGELRENPFDRITIRVPRISRKPVDLTEQDVAALVANATSPEWARAIGLAAYAGLRLSQIRRLEWRDVDIEGRRIVVRAPGGRATTKEHTHTAKIEPELAAILADARDPDGPRVAPISASNVRRNIDAIAARAGVAPWGKPMHGLRSWCAVWLKGRGYPAAVVAAWLGHGVDVARDHYDFVPESLYTGESEVSRLRRRVAELESEVESLRRAAILPQTTIGDSQEIDVNPCL